MNDMILQIKNRKSIRLFENTPISELVKNEIINAAFEAPTAGAMMLYTILDITDQELKEKLAKSCDNQPFIAKAPLVLIFLADYNRWYNTYLFAECNPRKPEEGDLLLAYSDAVIAAQNTVVAAESFGVGSCYIGDILENYETIQDILNLPDYTIPAAMLVYGYPTQTQLNRKKPARFEKEYIVFENQYKELTSENLIKMYQKRNSKEQETEENIKDFIKKQCNRKYMSEFSLEMSRSARKYITQWQRVK